MERVFLWLPIETLIHEKQEEYYEAINAANIAGESTIFVKFMIEVIKDSLTDLIQVVAKKSEEPELSNQDKLLVLLKKDGTISAKKMAGELGLSDRQVQRLLKILKDDGQIERVGSNKNGLWKVL